MLAYVVFPAKRNLTNQPSFASDTSNPSPEFLTTMTTPRSSPRDPRQEVSVTVSTMPPGLSLQPGAKHHRRQMPNFKTPKTPKRRPISISYRSPYIGNFNAMFMCLYVHNTCDRVLLRLFLLHVVSLVPATWCSPIGKANRQDDRRRMFYSCHPWDHPFLYRSADIDILTPIERSK